MTKDFREDLKQLIAPRTDFSLHVIVKRARFKATDNRQEVVIVIVDFSDSLKEHIPIYTTATISDEVDSYPDYQISYSFFPTDSVSLG